MDEDGYALRLTHYALRLTFFIDCLCGKSIIFGEKKKKKGKNQDKKWVTAEFFTAHPSLITYVLFFLLLKWCV
jgi:hypothetical protein